MGGMGDVVIRAEGLDPRFSQMLARAIGRGRP